MRLTFLFFAVLALLFCALLLLRLRDWRMDRAEWLRLAAQQPADPLRFHPAMVADLPESAQRFFKFAIAPGTPLLSVAEIDMGGQFSLGTGDAPNYRPMQAQQILAGPHGFVWRMRLPGWVPVSGSDAGSESGSWTRFRILGFIPVARMGNGTDHVRSAYGRCVAEAVFWTPAALLPGPGVTWEGVGRDTARVTVAIGALSQAVDVALNAAGQPITVGFMRWTDANPGKQYRLQPFGGMLSDFREVRGYRLPFRVEAGNMFGTDEQFIFYKAEVIDIRFRSGRTSNEWARWWYQPDP
jgi:hypothetical protein